MPAFKLQQFDGVYPRQGAYYLPDMAAQIAENVKLYSGEIRAWRKPVAVSPAPAIKAGANTVYHLERPSDGAAAWLSWTADVDVVPSPIADSSDGRIYYTGEATPRKTTYALATSGAAPYPFDYYEWGVPAPLTAPTLASTGGSGGAQTRVYVYTYVSQFGSVEEESAPSLPATVTSQATGATVTVSGLGTAGPAGKYNFTKKRIYRTIGGTTGTDYRLVAEIPITQASYSDTVDDAAIPGDLLMTLSFLPPPSDLVGVVSMPGNFLAGFRRGTNEIWFSEPGFPHAWPAEYVLTVDYQAVGLGVVGNLLVVMTVRQPEMIYGQTPDALGQEKIALVEPCASKRSIATTAEGVIYASPNGLVMIGPGYRDRFTDQLFKRTEFERFNPASIYGRVYDGIYFGYFNSVLEGTGAFLINSKDQPAMSRLSDERYTEAAYVDARTAGLFYVDSMTGALVQFDADPVNNDIYRWRSKKFDTMFPASAGVVQVYADYGYLAETVYNPTADIAYNTGLIAGDAVQGAVGQSYITEFEITGSALIDVAVAGEQRFLQILLYGDGEPIKASNFTAERSVKQPGHKRYRTLEVEAVGNVPIRYIAVGTTVADLKEV